MKILHIGDIHQQGKTFDKCNEAYKQVHQKVRDMGGVDLTIISGDLFNKRNICDRYKTTGEQIKLVADFLKHIHSGRVLIMRGNHDGEALEALREIPSIMIVDKPCCINVGACGDKQVKLGLIPWVTQSKFYSEQCVGLSKSESQQRFNETTQNMLGVFKSEFNDAIGLLFGHLELNGQKINNYLLEGGSFSFNKQALIETGAKAIGLSHIHKREGFYVGCLLQHGWKDEGCSQGFEVYDIKEDGSIDLEYHELELPKFVTIDVYDASSVSRIFQEGIEDIHKLRFYEEAAYNYVMENIPICSSDTIEKLFTKQAFVKRTDKELTSKMSDKELIEVYMSINKLPEGITKDQILVEAVQNFQYQTEHGEGNGNCFATCIANILGLDVAEVPNFVREMDDWLGGARAYCSVYGYDLICISSSSCSKKFMEYYMRDNITICLGPTERGTHHAVVYNGTELMHDPIPDGEGITEITDIILFIKKNPVKLRTEEKPNENTKYDY